MSANKSKNRRLGLLGGTFDPPHKGHVEISKYAIKKLNLSSLIWAITKKNPMKKIPFLTLKKRVLLSKNKVNKIKKVKVKSFDKTIRSSKTIDLIKYINKNKKLQIFFLMGSDNLISFHKWHEWKKISELVKIVVFPRKGFIKRLPRCKAFKVLGKEKILFMKSKKVDISSSKLRKNYVK